MSKHTSTGKGKRPYHHGALREAMLEAAERILDREGIEGLTLRAAAREAGASHAAPKNHFENLTGLLSDLATVGFQRFERRFIDAVAAVDTPEARLPALGRAYVEFATDGLRVHLAALVAKHRALRHHAQFWNRRQVVDQAPRDSVAEIIVLRVATHVLERQDGE